MKPSNQKVVIIAGPPGSGKGTQAELLAEKLGLYHLDTSKIIGKKLENIKESDFVKVEGKKYFLVEEKKIKESGGLMSPPLITFWVKEKIKELAKEGEGIVTSASPRTLYEGKKIIPFLKSLYRKKFIKIILLKLSAKEAIWRNSHRKICQLIRHPILYTKETAKLTRCPFDGSKLVTRKDDAPETIKVRLKEYRERTLPLIDYFKKQGLKVKEVNGEQSVEEVFKDILKQF